MNKIIGYIKAFCQLRFLYTIWFNYKYLPVKQAQKLPFRFYKAAYASISKGSKIIVDDDYIKNGGRIHIGLHTLDFEYQCEKTHLNIYNGILVIHGLLDLRRGCIFDIKGSAEFGNDIVFGPRCRVRIHNSLTIGSHVRIAHETQIFDSNFHYMENINAPGFYPISKPIKIGSHCWIGNRSTFNPGAIIPEYTTVASNSLVNKNFETLNPYSIIGGMPAKFLKEGYTRVWDTNREKEYHKREFKWDK